MSSFARRITRTVVTVSLLGMIASAATAQGGLTFDKTFVPSTIGPGSVTTLRFEIVNLEGVAVRNVAFVDDLPTGTAIADPANVTVGCPGTVDAPAGGGTITFSDGGVGAGSTCVITVDVTAAAPGTYTNLTGDLTSDAGNSGPATADLVVATDRPGFTKSFTPNAAFFGGRSRLEFVIDNSANAALRANLTFTDSLPAGMTVASPANVSNTCGGGVVGAAAGAAVVSYGPAFFTDATVAAGATCTIGVDVIAGAVGTLGNTTGELTSTTQFGFTAVSSGKASDSLTVTVERIAATKTFLDDPVPPGTDVVLSFTVINLDRRSDAADIAFTDDLDAVLSGLVAVGLPASGVCGAGSTLSGTSVLTLSGGSLGIEESCTFSVTLQVPADAVPGDYTNTTSAVTASFGGEPVVGDPASDILEISPVPVLTKEFTDDPAGSGGTVTLAFSITNTSAVSGAMDIAFQDFLGAELPSAVTIPSAGFCGPGSTAAFIPGTNSDPPRLIVSGGSLEAGASCSFEFVLAVVVGAQGGTYPNTTTEITATIAGETVVGPPASDDLLIVGPPTLLKSFVDDPAQPGGTVTLEFTLEHEENASADATAIAFSDDLSATLAGLEAVGLPATDVCGVGSSISGTTNLSFSGGILAPAETCSFTVTLNVPADAPAGSHTNTTSAVVADVLGVATTGRAASDDLVIAGLVLTKEFVDDPTLPGGTVTLRYTVENQSPVSAATAIVFQDDLNAAVTNMAAITPLPLVDPCGAGSTLTGSSANRFLTLQGGSLAVGASCTFDVELLVPATTVPETYPSTTSLFFATIEGSLVVFENASDDLVVAADFLAFDKIFLDDPAAPGETVDLEFTIENLHPTGTIADITFSDDLDAALSGLASVSGTLIDPCGVGSQLGGTDVVTLTGGSLAAGATCSFTISLTVPGSVELGTVATNVTSQVLGSLGGLEVRGEPARDELQIDFVAFGKAFDGPVEAGGTATLTFTITNLGTFTLEDLSFVDDLDAVLAGLQAVGLPAFDVCGEGSVLSGGSTLFFTGGSLLPGGSCSFSVDVEVPGSASAGTYLNVTSALTQGGTSVAQPATATLEVIEVVDADGDGVLDGDDLCPGTVIPEGVPTQTLKPNRYALIDADFVFDTLDPHERRIDTSRGQTVFTTTDTAGCSCEQIIEALDLGNGHTKFGCSLGAMREWVDIVNGGAGRVLASTPRSVEPARPALGGGRSALAPR